MTAEILVKKALKSLLDQERKALSLISSSTFSDIEKAALVIADIPGKIVVTGVGKSSHIGMKISSTLTSLGVSAVFLHSAEASHGDLGLLGAGDALLALSYSGETKETVQFAKQAHKYSIPIVSITDKKNSSLGKLSSAVIPAKISAEGSPHNVAPMASSTATLVLGDLLAVGLCAIKGFTKEDFARRHPGGSLGLSLTPVSELMVIGKDMPLVKRTAPLMDALEMIEKKGLGVTGVVNNKGALEGVITDSDVRMFLMSGKYHGVFQAEDTMQPTRPTVSRDDTLKDAIRLMEHHKKTALFVVDSKSKPLGVISMHAIIEANLI